MKLSIKYTNLASTPALQNHIQAKFAVLEKLIAKFDQEGSVELFVEIAKSSRHHHKGDVFMAEARLKIPKKEFVVREEGSDAYLTIDHAKDTLKEVLEKHKDRLKDKK